MDLAPDLIYPLDVPAVPDSVKLSSSAAPHMRIPVWTLQRWRLDGKGPPHFKVGKHVRSSMLDLNAWIALYWHANDLAGHRIERAVRLVEGA